MMAVSVLYVIDVFGHLLIRAPGVRASGAWCMRSNPSGIAGQVMDYRQVLHQNTVLDRKYRIDRVIGSGGFGITYEAFDLGLATSVAIKEYYPEGFSVRDSTMSIRARSETDRPVFDRLRASFLREARTLAKFDNGTIVRVLNVFETHGTAYMVMKYETGPSFKVWLEKLGRRPTQSELDQIAWPLLSALEVMHVNDFLHRDVAPDNIIIRHDGSPVMLDFGASRRVLGESTGTVTGIVKKGYSPQEQYATDGRSQGAWTDIYAMAATLYRAIASDAPMEATERMLDDQMVPASAVGRGAYRPEFLAAVDGALRVRPRERPQTIAEWRRQLFRGSLFESQIDAIDRSGPSTGPLNGQAPHLQSRPSAPLRPSGPVPAGLPTPSATSDHRPGARQAPAPTGPQQNARGTAPARPSVTPSQPGVPRQDARPGGQPSGQRSPTPPGIAASDAPARQANGSTFERNAILGMAALIASALFFFAFAPVRTTPPTVPNIPEAQLRLPPPVAVPDPQRPSPASQSPAPQPAIGVPSPDLKEKEKAEAEAKARRDAEAKAKAEADLRARAEADAKAKREREEKAREDAQRAAKAETDAKAKREREEKAREDAQRAAKAEAEAKARREAEEKEKARQENERIAREDAERRAREEAERVEQLRRTEAERARLAALPRQLPFAEGTGDPAIVPISVEFGSRIIAAGGTKGLFRIWDAANGNRRDIALRHADAVSSIALSPDEARIATGAWDGEVRLWTSDTGAAQRTVTAAAGDRSNVVALRFAAPSRLVVIHASGIARVVDPSSGQLLTRSQTQPALQLWTAGVSRDGSVFLGALPNGDIQAWSVANGRPIRTLKGHTDRVTGLAYSADGRLLTSGSLDGTVRLWNAATGAPLRTLGNHGLAIRAVEFAPNGAMLASADVGGTIVVWNPTNGARIQTLTGHRGQIRALGFSTDSTRLTSAGEDGDIRVWYFDADPAKK